MGNSSQKQNTNFNANYNMSEHNRKMSQLNNNYHNHDLSIPQQRSNKIVKQQTRTNILRKNAIYKPSINLKTTNNTISIDFQYFSQNGCKLIIYAFISNIIQDDKNQKTLQIYSDYKFEQELKSAKKQRVSFNFNINSKQNQINKKQLIIRVQSLNQASQYEFRKGIQTNSTWSIILQKLQTQFETYQIENIFKGGEQQQDCIVCMSQISNTIVKPCNHMCLCKECAGLIGKSSDKCPICRKIIQELVTLAS